MKLRNVVVAHFVPMSSGFQTPLSLTGPDWEVTMLDFPWVLVEHKGRKANGKTTIFNVVGCSAETSDFEQKAALEAKTAGEAVATSDASQQASPGKRRS